MDLKYNLLSSVCMGKMENYEKSSVHLLNPNGSWCMSFRITENQGCLQSILMFNMVLSSNKQNSSRMQGNLQSEQCSSKQTHQY